ncbi:MAG: hypothetical protein ABFC90_08515 [Bacteroidales bacterium]|nr:hypothetical protein [Bacteroidales bacterium]
MKRALLIAFSFMALFLLVYIEPAAGIEKKTSDLQLAVFDMDVTPPIGYKLAYGTMVNTYDMGLRAKGIVLIGSDKPIVLVVLDWIGIANDCYDEFKRSIAVAAGTDPEHVAVHVIHQHDAPYANIHDDFTLAVIHRLSMAVANALTKTVPITHIGLGEAQVYQVASTRRPLGKDGKVIDSRFTSCADSSLRAEPEGTIDPMVSKVSFWNEDKPVAVLSYYATHPQSYYRVGIPTPEFPGIARFYRQLEVPDAIHVYFTGAGANVGAGKYNDGSHENRGILAKRLADGMTRAWENTKRYPITASEVKWTTEAVALPLDSARTNQELWLRYQAGKKFDLQCLALNNKARILFMPGELFVEYQLAAKKMRPDLFVAMAAYGDLGPGYIPTAAAFNQGGYEMTVEKVTPEAETVLLNAIAKLLNTGH